MKKNFLKTLALFILSLSFISSSIAKELKEQITLKNYSMDNSNEITIPIKEASGVAVDRRSGLIYIHEDSNNSNKVYVFNNDGKLKNKFSLKGFKNHDWEDITGDGNGTFWIIDSKVSIGEFKADVNGDLIDDSIKTYFLPKELIGKNVESLDYLPEENKFIAIYKGKDQKIYKFSLGDESAKLLGKIPKRLKVKPSGLCHNPQNGHFYMISFWGHKIIEFSSDFKKVLNVLEMPESLSFQPEGIDFDKNLNLLIVVEKPWHTVNGHSKLIKLFNSHVKINVEK